MNKATIALIIGVGLSLCACDSHIVSREEIERLTSPDEKADAILVKSNAGATTPFTYSIYLAPKGKDFRVGFENFVADHIENLKLEWSQPKLLKISYDQARIHKFSNFWQSKELEDWSYVVELRSFPPFTGQLRH